MNPERGGGVVDRSRPVFVPPETKIPTRSTNVFASASAAREGEAWSRLDARATRTRGAEAFRHEKTYESIDSARRRGRRRHRHRRRSFIRTGDFAGLFPAPRESRGERVNLDARATRDARRARDARGKIEGKSSLVDRSSRSLARGRARVNGSTVRVGTRRWTKKCTRGWIWCFLDFFKRDVGDIDCRRLRAR